jgi:Raf kinase inhibitor-like YbhB/YbcL family protein
MKLWSNSWTNGDRIPERHAAGRPDGAARAVFSDNISPHLAWSDLPAGTKSLVLVCHDFDAPTRADDVNQPGREVPADLVRTDFFHWVLVDLPPTPAEIAEGAFSCGFTPRGKSGPELPGPPGAAAARHGLNDYTRWFAGDPELAGRYFGYDGPFPPWNDSLVHHYVFTLYAVAEPRLPLVGVFDGPAVRAQLAGLVLGAATFSGTYTLNARLLAEAS